MRWRREAVALVLSAVAAVAVVTVPVTGSSPPEVAQAADTSQFMAGNIITDQLFFNGNAMSAASVQSFLNVRNPNCVAGAMPCLKNYRQTTSTRTATTKCPTTYTGATSETAATIIARVGQVCGVSQRVLLVILQKEEGLVTASGSSLSATRYRSAMGFGCPDTAACDSQYYGFFNQVYSAAAQYKKYAANPTYYSHRAGMNNSILFNPNKSCGSSSVYIANQATAGLYNYTPYQPNAAALAAGAGSGNTCSAYGNRNFWIYFTNWFGSTQTAGAGALVDLYVSTGGASGYLGSVTSAVTCGLLQGGCSQGYSGGAIYWSPTTGARVVRTGAIKDLWASTGSEHGRLGYPTSSTGATADRVGQYQHFQNGSVFWSTATGARVVSGPIKTLWAAGGYERGPLGYPISSTGVTADGVGQYQHFKNGSVFWSPTTGAQTVSGSVRTLWASAGYERGPLGYPTTSTAVTTDGAGQYQRFQTGAIFSTSTTGTRSVTGQVMTLWSSTGEEHGPLGYPMTSTAAAAAGGGSFSVFQHGRIYWSAATGAHSVSGPIADRWLTEGAEGGALGFPTTSVVTGADGLGQYVHFEHGSIAYVSGSPAREVTGPIRDRWVATGADKGLGYPTSDETTNGDGVGKTVTFQTGSILWSPSSGAHVVSGPIHDMWAAAGNEHGPLGYPITDVGPTADRVGQYQHFQNGSVFWTQATGARTLTGPIRDLWASAGYERGPLGYPTTSVGATSDGVGRYQHFQHGSIFWSPGTAARSSSGPVLALWASTGYERGPLGYPTTSAGATSDGVGRYQHFQHGSIFWSPTTGARLSSGPVLALWASTGYERGRLGYPTTSVGATSDGVGRYQHFQHGSIFWSPGTGARLVSGPVLALWASTGYERGPLGYPTMSVSWAADRVGQYLYFQHGAVFWSPTTGAHAVRGTFLTAWAGTGNERGTLGYPTKDAYAVTGGTRMNFQHGWITVSTATGKATVTIR